MTPPSAQTLSDTPRVDAALRDELGRQILWHGVSANRLLDLARQLERELGEMQNLNAVNESGCNNALERLELSARVCAELTVAFSKAQAKIAELEKWRVQAKTLLAQFALGYDTFNEPETCLNWAQVEELVKETRSFLTSAAIDAARSVEGKK